MNKTFLLLPSVYIVIIYMYVSAIFGRGFKW